VEEQKKQVQANLAARVALLKAQGVEGKELEKDPHVRKLKADIRKAGVRLRSIAAAEALNSQRLQKTQEKAAADKQPKSAKKEAEKPVKKEKKAKEKKQAAAE